MSSDNSKRKISWFEQKPTYEIKHRKVLASEPFQIAEDHLIRSIRVPATPWGFAFGVVGGYLLYKAIIYFPFGLYGRRYHEQKVREAAALMTINPAYASIHRIHDNIRHSKDEEIEEIKSEHKIFQQQVKENGGERVQDKYVKSEQKIFQ